MLDPSLRPGANQDHKHRANTMHTLATQRRLLGLLPTAGPCYHEICTGDRRASAEDRPEGE
jgi:hypothetical protein